MKRTVRRTDTTGVANPLTGLVFCADCGAKMYNHRGKRKKDGREYGTDFYNCSTYTLTFERETQMCSSHTVSTKALNALILETIRTTASYAIQNKEEFIQKVRSIMLHNLSSGCNFWTVCSTRRTSPPCRNISVTA